jgi:hypothetical protein
MATSRDSTCVTSGVVEGQEEERIDIGFIGVVITTGIYVDLNHRILFQEKGDNTHPSMKMKKRKTQV